MSNKKLLILNEVLETSSSEEDEINILAKVFQEKRPKIKNYINTINEYSDKEVKNI